MSKRNDLDELYVGSVKLYDKDGNPVDGVCGSIELVLSKTNRALERADAQLALKKFNSRHGEETSIMLHISELSEEDKSKFRTHSLRINVNYRQK